jgi:heat shock 70kDa protein 1/2/6/8
MDIFTNNRALLRLKNSCEMAKRTLSVSAEASIELETLAEGVDYFTTITRAKFEELNMDYFIGCLDPVERVLRDARLAKNDVHEVVLVGGSSRIPMVRQLLRDFFHGKELCKTLNPDEAVACGAAVQGAIMSGDQSSQLKNLLLLPATTHSIGVDSGGLMNVLFSRNSTVPTKFQVFTTSEDNQTSLCLRVFEGERQMTKDCCLLCTVAIEGVTPAPSGCPKIQVRFDVGYNRVEAVTACELETGKEMSVRIYQEGNKVEDIERMSAEAKRLEEQDREMKGKVEAKNGLGRYLQELKDVLNGMESKVQEMNDWLERSDNASAEEVYGKKKEMEDIIAQEIMKIHAIGTGIAEKFPEDF